MGTEGAAPAFNEKKEGEEKREEREGLLACFSLNGIVSTSVSGSEPKWKKSEPSLNPKGRKRKRRKDE